MGFSSIQDVLQMVIADYVIKDQFSHKNYPYNQLPLDILSYPCYKYKYGKNDS